jgi:hypothetical protein
VNAKKQIVLDPGQSAQIKQGCRADDPLGPSRGHCATRQQDQDAQQNDGETDLPAMPFGVTCIHLEAPSGSGPIGRAGLRLEISSRKMKRIPPP